MGSHSSRVNVYVTGHENENPWVSKLINSVCYFLEDVFIIVEGSSYRLIVRHKNELLANGLYQTLRGAKIGFDKLFRDKSFNKQTKAEWSHFYSPEKEWLNSKIEQNWDYNSPFKVSVQKSSVLQPSVML